MEGSSPSSRIGGKSIGNFPGEATVRADDGWGVEEGSRGATIAAGAASGTTGERPISPASRGRARTRGAAFPARLAMGRASEGFGDTAETFDVNGAMAAATFWGLGRAAGTEDSGRRGATLAPRMLGAAADRVSRRNAGVPLPVATISFDVLESFAVIDVFKTCGGVLGAFSPAVATTTGAVAVRRFFLASADLTGLVGTAGVTFFFRTLGAERVFVCAGRLIESGMARCTSTTVFEGVGFAGREAALGAGDERAFQEVERTREAAVFLPA